ncbi:hypothetical protein B0H34DRAFT_391843 [Crassisporium funariophilum]|nr:hypothetical protein B0H34DRAFT_391843 [Crassisporium funariophilum]
MNVPGGNILVTGGTWNNINGGTHSHGQRGFELLRSSIAEGAFHNSGERFEPPKCHPGTRGAILAKIMSWIKKDQRKDFIMWLFGPAGAGKSALAQTIAEMCFEQGLLLATFFFSRTTPGRNSEKRLIATIAYQIAIAIPLTRQYIESVINSDPSILSRSLQAQFQKLVVEPLEHASSGVADVRSPLPRLVIIDGLDECQDAKLQTYILTTLALAVHKSAPPIIFLIASRPEQHISIAFTIEPLESLSCRLALDDAYEADYDIRLFFKERFREITKIHPLKRFIPEPWPSVNVIDELIRKAHGQFIYASTVGLLLLATTPTNLSQSWTRCTRTYSRLSKTSRLFCEFLPHISFATHLELIVF